MTDTTKAPHCPRCGGEMVRELTPDDFDDAGVEWAADCGACGFGDARIAYDTRKDAEKAARRLIRAELARQALEMRAHSAAQAMLHTQNSVYTLDDNMQCVMKDYIWLGEHRLRLPGEGA